MYSDAPRRVSRWITILVSSAAACAYAGGAAEIPEPCSDGWNRYVEEKLVSGDGKGHGPDLGSEEWKGVIEFKLGVRGQPDVPPRDTEGWCLYVDRLVRER